MDNCLFTPMNNKLSKLVRVDYITISLVMGITGLLSSLGFLIGTAGNSNYIAIGDFAPFYMWALWFAFYGGEKIVEIIYNVPNLFRGLNSLFGMWLWNYIMLSFLFFDPKPSYPLEYIIIMPLILELWYLTSLIFISKSGRKDSNGI